MSPQVFNGLVVITSFRVGVLSQVEIDMHIQSLSIAPAARRSTVCPACQQETRSIVRYFIMERNAGSWKQIASRSSKPFVISTIRQQVPSKHTG